MEIHKEQTVVTDSYGVIDGPVEDTSPRRVPGKFKVEYLSVSYTDGILGRVYVYGPTLTVDGQLGKSRSARSFYGDYPQWVLDFLNNQTKEEK